MIRHYVYGDQRPDENILLQLKQYYKSKYNYDIDTAEALQTIVVFYYNNFYGSNLDRIFNTSEASFSSPIDLKVSYALFKYSLALVLP
jgi:hypothetical protein